METSETLVETEDQARGKVRVFLTGACDGIAELREEIASHPDVDLVGWCEDVRDAAGALSSGRLQVVLHATPMGSHVPSEVATIRERTKQPIVLLSPDHSERLIEEALKAGVADVLFVPQAPEGVVFAVRKANQTSRRLEEGAAQGRRGRIVTVFSPKGGTGKSVVSTNLACALARYEGQRTLLLDLDLQFGDSAIMLGLEPEKTIYDLVVAPGELDSEKLAGYTTRHASGIEVLPAPLRPEDAEFVTEAKVTRLLEVARETFDVIVVDTSPFFHGPMLATLDRSDELLLLCGLDVPTLKNVRLSMQTLELVAFPSDRVSLVLNHPNGKGTLRRSEIEKALETKVRFEVPHDGDIPSSVNRGHAPVLNGASKGFKRAMRELARSVAATEPVTAKRKAKAPAATPAVSTGEPDGGRKRFWPALRGA